MKKKTKKKQKKEKKILWTELFIFCFFLDHDFEKNWI